MPSSEPTYDCIPNIEYTLSGDQDFNYEPVDILWHDTDNVIISVSQTWSESPICYVTTYYESSETGSEICDTLGNVPAGEFAYYKLKCEMGYAEATIYLQDGQFSGDSSIVSVPNDIGCDLLQANFEAGAETISYHVRIPCVVEQENCAPPAPLVCDGTSDMFVQEEVGFENGEAFNWLYGQEASNPELSTYLVAQSEVTTKAFDVPVDSSAIVVKFDIYEEANLPSMTIQLQGQDFVLGSFDTTKQEELSHGYLGDIWTEVKGISLTSNNVMLTVPARWYPAGRLTVSFGDNVGIDNFSIEAICSTDLEALEEYGPGWTPAPSSIPSVQPSIEPSSVPSVSPSAAPSANPSVGPSALPSMSPSSHPSSQPSGGPSTMPSSSPSESPSSTPTAMPSESPSHVPSSTPTLAPSGSPSELPSSIPSSSPSASPSTGPSAPPSTGPSAMPSSMPSQYPTVGPSSQPSARPSIMPSTVPSIMPSASPSIMPSSPPSGGPSSLPSIVPSASPSSLPSTIPSASPSPLPSAHPSSLPSLSPSAHPSSTPTLAPSAQPSSSPSSLPSQMPSVKPSSMPSMGPSANPSANPSSSPSLQPSALPSAAPSSQPSSVPNIQPSASPSVQPSVAPSSVPSSSPSFDCIENIEYTPESGFDYPPIEVLWHDTDSVIIGVSQSWSDSPICLLATYYKSSETSEMTCETKGQVESGEFGYYKAECVNGYADVTVFLQDPLFSGELSVDSVPGECALIQAGLESGADTVSYNIHIPCAAEADMCPSPSPMVCAGDGSMEIVPLMDFENAEASSWWYGEEDSSSELSTYLVAQDSLVTKTFDVPIDSAAVNVHFSFYEISDLLPMVVGIQGQDLVLGDYRTNIEEGTQDGFFGDIWTVVTGNGLTANSITLTIPARWYPLGRLTVSFGPTVGIDNFSIDAECGSPLETLSYYGPDSTEPPTATPSDMPTPSPTMDCVPNIVYTPSGSVKYDFPPIDIISTDMDTVTFSVSQVWSNNPVCLISTDYVSADTGDKTCDTKDNVPSGEFAFYKALCEDGFTTITMYVQDSIFTEYLDEVPPRCEPLEAGPNTISYEVIIPCGSESTSCPPIAPKSCGVDDVSIHVENFDSGIHEGWMYSVLGESHKFNKYITTMDGEMQKSFDVPPDSSAVTLQFTFHELNELNSMQFRIQGIYVKFGEFSKIVAEEDREGFLGDIYALVKSDGPESNKATLVIPPGWYPSGHLSIAFGPGVGIDDLSISPSCPATAVKASSADPGSSCPCACSSSSEILPYDRDWDYPGLPAESLLPPTDSKFEILPCLGLAQDATNPKMATSCNDPDTVYYLVQDDSNRLTALLLKGEQWAYMGRSQFVNYESSTDTVNVVSGAGSQDYDLQTRGSEVCMTWHDSAVNQVLVYCFTDGMWTELGATSQIPGRTGFGDIELLMPSACECSEWTNYYFVIVGDSSSATVWFHDGSDQANGWQPLGESFESAGDAHIAIPRSGSFKCTLHAAISDSSGSIKFARLQQGSPSKTDPLGLTGGKWVDLCQVTSTSVKPHINDFVFTKSGIPAVAWVEDSAKSSAYLSVWTDYPNSAENDFGGFVVAASNTGKDGAIPPFASDKPVYEDPRGVSIDVYGEVVFVAITDNGSGGDTQAGQKVYLSYINLSENTAAEGCPWYEYEIQTNELLPQDQEHSVCSDDMATYVRGDSESHIKISCNGNIYMAHVIKKAEGPLNIASLARNGMPESVTAAADSNSARREEAIGESEFQGAEPSLDNENGTFYCSAADYPCGETDVMVYVCHYSARSGYQTFCVPEADSEILRFFAHDYCGPCVSGFGGVNQE